MPRLKKDFYFQPTKKVARELIGKVLCVKHRNKVHRLRISETEAYLGVDDPACHTHKGRCTPRVASMYLPGGHLYVYFIYGMYFCANVVCGHNPEAVLIRAGIPLDQELPEKSCSGPGKLCQTLGIDRAWDGESLLKRASKIWIEEDGFVIKRSSILATPRIGIDYSGDAKHWPLRFVLKKV